MAAYHCLLGMQSNAPRHYGAWLKVIYVGDKFTPFFWRYLRWRPPHILWNCLNSWNLFLIFIVPLTYLEVIFVSPVLEACCYGACLQPTPRYCSESGEACRFPCHGNTRACKVLKGSGWEMKPPPPPPKTYAILALLAGSHLKGLLPVVLMSLFTMANLCYQLSW